jgi:hypothetical protein
MASRAQQGERIGISLLIWHRALQAENIVARLSAVFFWTTTSRESAVCGTLHWAPLRPAEGKPTGIRNLAPGRKAVTGPSTIGVR